MKNKLFKKKIMLIAAARSDSQRLPNKAFIPFPNDPMIIVLLNRVKNTKNISKVLLATTNRKIDDKLAHIVEKSGFNVFRGDNKNLVKRFVDAANLYDCDYVIRVTGDCPFVNSDLIEYCLDQIKDIDFDLATTKGNFPQGVDIEIYRSEVLSNIYIKKLLSKNEKEHMLNYIYNNERNYNIVKIKPKKNWISNILFTIDDSDDLKRALSIVNKYGANVTIDEAVGNF